MMRRLLLMMTVLILAGCTWETYQNEAGHTSLRPKYERGSLVYYQDGSYSNDMRYNKFRPEPHVIKPLSDEQPSHADRTNWSDSIERETSSH